jgi:dihydrofolate reductase
MGRLTSFIYVSVDGYYAGPNGETDWFKDAEKDPEYEAWTHAQAQGGGTLLFGRTTYEMMKSWWPTPKAIAADPKMARVVGESPKIVFSRKLIGPDEGPNWKNVTVVHGIDRNDIKRRKDEAEGNLTILGSGTVVQQLSNLGLVDEYDLVVVPVVLGEGKPLFDDVKKKALKLVESRSFKNGLTLLRYTPS